jgi:hypothetical protein
LLVDILARPFVRAWDWISDVGGFPGQMAFVCATVMLVIGLLTWYGNRR